MSYTNTHKSVFLSAVLCIMNDIYTHEHTQTRFIQTLTLALVFWREKRLPLSHYMLQMFLHLQPQSDEPFDFIWVTFYFRPARWKLTQLQDLIICHSVSHPLSFISSHCCTLFFPQISSWLHQCHSFFPLILTSVFPLYSAMWHFLSSSHPSFLFLSYFLFPFGLFFFLQETEVKVKVFTQSDMAFRLMIAIPKVHRGGFFSCLHGFLWVLWFPPKPNITMSYHECSRHCPWPKDWPQNLCQDATHCS